MATPTISEQLEHTPTPWEFDEVHSQSGRCFRIGSRAQLDYKRTLSEGNSRRLPSYACLYDDGHYGGDSPAAANAAFIVKCVNAHDDLLAALKALLPEGWGDDETMYHMPGVKQACEAIAKAEGRS
jgi:hypothetical protein